MKTITKQQVINISKIGTATSHAMMDVIRLQRYIEAKLANRKGTEYIAGELLASLEITKRRLAEARVKSYFIAGLESKSAAADEPELLKQMLH